MGVSGHLRAPAALPQERNGCTNPIRSQVVPRASGQIWTCENLSPLPGFEPRTTQPVASHYIAYVIPTHFVQLQYKIIV
jgi:hypothetical protein